MTRDRRSQSDAEHVLMPYGVNKFLSEGYQASDCGAGQLCMERRRRSSSNTMKLKVECYAGYRGEEEPVTFLLGERRIEVIQIVDRWLSPEHRYFKVQADDGGTYILRHDEPSGRWDLTLFQAR
jgi:hypothetical protein